MAKQKGSFLDQNGMKKCSKCLETKTGDEFSNAKKFKDGKDPYCKACKKLERKMRLARDPDYERRYAQEYNLKNTDDQGLTYHQRKYLDNKEKTLAYQREYQRKNGKSYRERCAAKRREYDRRREAAKLMRTPSWLTKEHKQKMLEIYQKSIDMGPEYHVDHIVPLIGANVCGLHVPWNLQVVTVTENLEKGHAYYGTDAWPKEVQMKMRSLRWKDFGKDPFC